MESVTFRYTEGPFSRHQDGRASGAVLESWAELTFLGEPQVGESHVAFQGLVMGTQACWHPWGEGTADRVLCACVSWSFPGPHLPQGLKVSVCWSCVLSSLAQEWGTQALGRGWASSPQGGSQGL